LRLSRLKTFPEPSRRLAGVALRRQVASAKVFNASKAGLNFHEKIFRGGDVNGL